MRIQQVYQVRIFSSEPTATSFVAHSTREGAQEEADAYIAEHPGTIAEVFDVTVYPKKKTLEDYIYRITLGFKSGNPIYFDATGITEAERRTTYCIRRHLPDWFEWNVQETKTGDYLWETIHHDLVYAPEPATQSEQETV